MATVVLGATLVNALKLRERVEGSIQRDADIRAVRMQLLLEANRDEAEDGDRYETLNNGEAEWQAQIEPTNIVDLFQVFFEIEFSEPQDEQAENYSEMLYLLRPTWSESDERSDLLQEKKEALEDSRDFSRL